MKNLLWALACLVAFTSAALASPAPDGNSGWQTVVGSGDLNLTLTTANTNDIIVVYTSPSGSVDLVTSITDTAGLTWTKRKTNGNTFDAEEWYAKSTGALTGDVISVHYSSLSSGAGGIAFGISGARFASPIDPGTSAAPTTGGPGPVSVSTYLANDLIVGMYRFSISSPTVGSGFTQLVSPTGTSNLVEYQSVSATQSNLSVAIGTGSTSVTGGLADAFTSDTDTLERSSKINTYSDLSNGTTSAMGASKIESLPILNTGTASAMGASKIVTYFVVKGQPITGLFHSFPP